MHRLSADNYDVTKPVHTMQRGVATFQDGQPVE